MTLERPAGPAWLDAMLAADQVVLIDGGTGTELEARGAPMDDKSWCAAATLEYGNVLRQVHEDYIRAGARVVIANTFTAGRHMLEPAGLGDRVAEVNRTAVRLAQEARDAAADREVAVAGSICEWVFDKNSRFTAPEEQAAALREQAGLLAEAGVELIALEMCLEPAQSALAVEAALATGLPVWAGMSCGRYPEEPRLQVFHGSTRGGGDFEALVEALAGYPLGAMTVMHSPLPDTAEGLELVRRHWQGPLGAYPEAGYFIMPNWQFQAVSDEELLAGARDWLARGARIIGGCCGLGPRHIAVLRDGLGL